MTNATTTCGPADASGTITCATVYAQSSSTDPYFYGGFTYGEIVITAFLFVIMLVACYQFLWFSVKGVKIKQ